MKFWRSFLFLFYSGEKHHSFTETISLRTVSSMGGRLARIYDSPAQAKVACEYSLFYTRDMMLYHKYTSSTGELHINLIATPTYRGVGGRT